MSTLYHYTSGTGLAGIAGTGKLWASSLRTLNDAQEFSYAVEMARSHIAKERLGVPLAEQQALNRTLFHYLDALDAVDVYVASFSQREDCLSLWRCYCPDGFGYALGMPRDALLRVAAETNFTLRQCIYEREAQEKLIQDWFTHALKRIEDGRGGVPADIYARRPENWNLDELVMIASILKHPSFVDEGEWRLISAPHMSAEKVKLRAARSYLVPYVEIELGPTQDWRPVSELWVGPTPSVKAAMHAAQIAAEKLRVPALAILSSSPYRGW